MNIKELKKFFLKNPDVVVKCVPYDNSYLVSDETEHGREEYDLEPDFFFLHFDADKGVVRLHSVEKDGRVIDIMDQYIDNTSGEYFPVDEPALNDEKEITQDQAEYIETRYDVYVDRDNMSFHIGGYDEMYGWRPILEEWIEESKLEFPDEAWI